MEGKKIVLLGDFDGVHLGHRAIVSEGVRLGKALSLPVCAWTFDTIRAEALTRLDERIRLLKEAGVDFVELCDFDSVRNMSCEDFVKSILRDRLNAEAVVCGYNYSFGRGGKGTPSDLKAICNAEGICVSVVDEVRLGDGEVSSSEIRRLIRNGRMSDAAGLLGRFWSCPGNVERGAGLGRTVGIPTVNVGTDRLILPKNGVYATVTVVDGERYPSVTNVGLRPTVNDGRGVTVESHIIDFEGDLYGHVVSVEFIERIRDERAFSSLEELSAQVKRDCNTAKELLKSIL